MFSFIKKYFFNKYLAENKPDRNVSIVSLSRARSIGILCEITDEDSYKEIFYIFSKLQEHGHQVRLIGYVNDKEVPFYCLPQLTADYFSQKHLNWYGIPNMPMQAILALSHAKFIVGRDPESQNSYDLFIDAVNSNYLKYLEAVSTYSEKLTGNDR